MTNPDVTSFKIIFTRIFPNKKSDKKLNSRIFCFNPREQISVTSDRDLFHKLPRYQLYFFAMLTGLKKMAQIGTYTFSGKCEN